MRNYIFTSVLGSAIGDAVGVPYEFKQRVDMDKEPAVDMIGGGSHGQNIGTWSDDTSMILATIDAMQYELDFDKIMFNFKRWVNDKEFTPHGKVFDMGRSTRYAIQRYDLLKVPALECGECSEHSNGNGSLMRTLPYILFCVYKLHIKKLCDSSAEIIHKGSSLTHSHYVSKIACGIYGSVVFEVIRRRHKRSIIVGLKKAYNYYSELPDYKLYLCHFDRLFEADFFKTKREDIQSTGYVVHTLEAAIWSVLTTTSYKESVLKAVNLGGDTDTIASITGGISGILYGLNNIPEEWKNNLVKYDFIEDLCNKNFSK